MGTCPSLTTPETQISFKTHEKKGKGKSTRKGERKNKRICYGEKKKCFFVYGLDCLRSLSFPGDAFECARVLVPSLQALDLFCLTSIRWNLYDFALGWKMRGRHDVPIVWTQHTRRFRKSRRFCFSNGDHHLFGFIRSFWGRLFLFFCSCRGFLRRHIEKKKNFVFVFVFLCFVLIATCSVPLFLVLFKAGGFFLFFLCVTLNLKVERRPFNFFVHFFQVTSARDGPL